MGSSANTGGEAAPQCLGTHAQRRQAIRECRRRALRHLGPQPRQLGHLTELRGCRAHGVVAQVAVDINV